jgi:hypothetical protein
MAKRIVLMFQSYRQNINPEDPVFLEHVVNHLKNCNVADPDSLPYHELYALVRPAVREFLRARKGVGDARRRLK